MKSEEYRGFSIRFNRRGNPPWTPFTWEAEALSAAAPKFWSAAWPGRGGKAEARKEIHHRIDLFHLSQGGYEPTEEELATPCTCRHVMTVGGRSYSGGIDACPVHGFGPESPE